MTGTPLRRAQTMRPHRVGLLSHLDAYGADLYRFPKTPVVDFMLLLRSFRALVLLNRHAALHVRLLNNQQAMIFPLAVLLRSECPKEAPMTGQ